MAIQQISVFVENKPGMLLKNVQKISEAGINLRALSIADTQDFGILRLIVSDVERTKEVLSADNLVTTTRVVAAKMEDEVGALYTILKALGDQNINIEYMYAFTASEAYGAYVVMRVDDVEQAEAALHASGIATLEDADI